MASTSAPSTIRALSDGDLGAVVSLFVRSFRKGPEHDQREMVEYFRRLYLQNPWVDEGMPSLVIERAGSVAGFLGVVPMPVRIDGVSLRLAIGGNLMVDPAVDDPMAASRLLRKYFAGNQDIAFTDTANEQALRMWVGLGGSVARLHTMRWMIPLRVGALGIAGVRRSGAGRRVAWLARPFVRPVDRIARGRIGDDGLGVTAQPATADEVAEFATSVGDRGYVHVDADGTDLEWLLTMCRAKRQFGPLRALVFHGASDRIVGAALYFPNRDGLGQVLQLLAREGSHGAVLSALVADARLHGSAALVGQGDPRLMVPLGDRVSCYVQRNEFVTLRPGSSPQAAAAAARVTSGDVSLSRLVGEWWTRMQGDTF